MKRNLVISVRVKSSGNRRRSPVSVVKKIVVEHLSHIETFMFVHPTFRNLHIIRSLLFPSLMWELIDVLTSFVWGIFTGAS
jgi:hypothetical protein